MRHCERKVNELVEKTKTLEQPDLSLLATTNYVHIGYREKEMFVLISDSKGG